MKILAIGNSFTQDATHYLSQIAATDGLDLKVVNIHIGGCTLKRHWENIENNLKNYYLEIDGKEREGYVSVDEALKMKEWDYIVTQQASNDSGILETYHPYLENIVNYLRGEKPNAKIMLQKTWAYESDSLHEAFVRYNFDQQEMYEKLSSAYASVSEENDLPLIPCGDIIQELRKKKPFDYGHGGMSICRDGFHMNVIYGRYLLAATWYKFITGRSICTNTYIPSTYLAPNAVCDEAVLQIIKETIDSML